MDKHIKTLLKSAKEAIKNKDHENALEKCKEVLSSDKNNYTALVFSGACYQEMANGEKTVEMFRAAIKQSPDLPLAWQGLGSYYEKSGSSKHQDSLIEVYTKLLTLVASDKAKCADLCAKLAWLQVHANKLDDCIETLHRWSSAAEGGFDPSKVTSVLRDKTVTSSQAGRIVPLLDLVITEESTARNKDWMSHRAALHHQLLRYGALLESARAMWRVFPDSVVAAEWILRVYVESDELVSDMDAPELFVSEAEPDNVWCRMCRGKRLSEAGDCSAALQQLDAAALGAAGDVAAVHALRGRLQLAVHSPAGAELSLRAALRHGTTLPLQLLLAQALVRQGAERAAEAEALLVTLAESQQRAALLAEARLRLGTLAEAEAKTSAAKEVYAEWLRGAGRVQEALTLLESDLATPQLSAERARAIAITLWELERYDESAARFLEAAKLDAQHGEPFYYLGRYYQQRGADPSRVLRCYQKAVRLCPGEPRASAALSDLYRQRGDHDANVALLTQVTAARPDATASRWAWFRLGLHYLQAGEHQRAVTCLQTTVKTQPDDAVAWECLGDAYRLRGALSSAVQAYGRAAAQLEAAGGEVVYARLQIAEVRRQLGQLQEAADGYQETLRLRPGYVPALKGLGETHLRRARELAERQLHGSARDTCQLAAAALSEAVRAQPRMSCLWKQLADVLCVTAALPERDRRLQPTVLLLQAEGRAGGTWLTGGAELAEAAVRCYSQALSIEPLGALWHDLAQAYRLRATLFSPDEKQQAESTALRALKCAEKAASLLPADRSVWNTLGVIASNNHVNDRRLAQHALVTSLRLEETAVTWTNLACLYMLNDQMMLAHQALTKAQSVEPSYGAAWTGQALIAELLSPEQATDLFRHAVHLAPHPLAAVGYGRWISRALRDPAAWATAQYRFNIERMQAVTVAEDALVWYTAAHPRDPAGWNLCGILAERQGRRATALAAYERALSLLEKSGGDPAATDAVRTNLARLLTATNQPELAVTQYGKLSAASFRSQCGLALALHAAGHAEQAYEAYEAALHWLEPDVAERSHTLVAVSTMLYQFGDAESARTQLLRSFQLEPASERGLLALTALALRGSDAALAAACQTELAARSTQPELAAERALLQACLRLARGEPAAAARAVQAAVRRWPGSAPLWRLLAATLLQLQPQSAATVTAAAAAHKAQIGSPQPAQPEADLLCQTLLCAGDGPAALRAAQRAVLCRPDSGAAWCELVAARLTTLQQAGPRRAAALAWLKAAVTRLRRTEQRLDRPVANWLSNVDRRVELLLAQA